MADNQDNYGLPSVQEYNQFWGGGTGDSPIYTGDTSTGMMRNFIQQNDSPLYGGPGWINPISSPGTDTYNYGKSWADNPDLLNYSSSGQISRSSGGSPGIGFNVPSGPTFPYGASGGEMPMGTPDRPAQSLSFSGPSLPAPEFGTPPSGAYDRYIGLLNNPESMSNDPLFKFLKSSGTQALDRKQAASGNRFAGKSLAEAEQFGTGVASDYFNRNIQNLLPAAQLEFQRWLQAQNLNLQRYGASRTASSSSSGAQPGTAREYGARDALARLFGGAPGDPMAGFDARQNYWNTLNANANAQSDREYQARLAQAQGQAAGGGGGGQPYYNPFAPTNDPISDAVAGDILYDPIYEM